jgi:hypothetical protein
MTEEKIDCMKICAAVWSFIVQLHFPLSKSAYNLDKEWQMTGSLGVQLTNEWKISVGKNSVRHTPRRDPALKPSQLPSRKHNKTRVKLGRRPDNLVRCVSLEEMTLNMNAFREKLSCFSKPSRGETSKVILEPLALFFAKFSCPPTRQEPATSTLIHVSLMLPVDVL